MSLAIDTIDTPIVFSSAVTATTPPINAVDTVTAVTTNYLNNIAFPLTVNNIITPTLSFTNNVVCNTISAILNGTLSFIGDISLGKSGGITTFYGTNPFVTYFPHWVQCASVHRKGFCGVYTSVSPAVIAFPTANITTIGGIALATATDNRTMGVSGIGTDQLVLRYTGSGTVTGNVIFFGI